MDFKKIFTVTDHRPYPIPNQFWIMKQVWLDLLFMHWKVPVEVIRKKIPKELDIDLWEGQAYLGIVPFRMEGIRPRFLLAVPWLSAFPELNVRTYVIKDGKPGVWFFSLDATNPIAVEIARTTFHLPYFNADMKCIRTNDKVEYHSIRKDNRGRPAELKMKYEAISDVYLATKGSLEHWLTERYCLYTSANENCYRGEIHHLPWPLRKASCEIEINQMGECHEITLPKNDPILHFVDRIEVGVFKLNKL
ncbi:MAG: DUF2071 domain-containing protein [Leptospiraceae bacterium]|nr:DUF2071 domain-containing protein [Leptospiraceae bacterium]